MGSNPIGGTVLIAPLAALAPRRSRGGSAYFVLARRRNSVSARSSSARRRAIRCWIAPLAALAPRGSRGGSAYFVLDRRRNSVSAPSSSARRRAIRCWIAPLAAGLILLGAVSRTALYVSRWQTWLISPRDTLVGRPVTANAAQHDQPKNPQHFQSKEEGRLRRVQ